MELLPDGSPTRAGFRLVNVGRARDLDRAFFDRAPEVVAADIIGCTLLFEGCGGVVVESATGGGGGGDRRGGGGGDAASSPPSSSVTLLAARDVADLAERADERARAAFRMDWL